MSAENPFENLKQPENEESPDQKTSREMIEAAQDMSFEDINSFTLRVYKRIKDPKIQQETYNILSEMTEKKMKDLLPKKKEQNKQTIQDWKKGKITTDEAVDKVNPPATKLGKKWREESRKNNKSK